MPTLKVDEAVSRCMRTDASGWKIHVRQSPGVLLTTDAERKYTELKVLGDGSFGTVWLCDWHSPVKPHVLLSAMQCGAGARPEWTGKRLVALKRMKRVWEGGWSQARNLGELVVSCVPTYFAHASHCDLSHHIQLSFHYTTLLSRLDHESSILFSSAWRETSIN